MKLFSEYVDQVVGLANQALLKRRVDLALVANHLNGEPARALRHAVSLHERQQSGAFFTGDKLRTAALETLPPPLSKTTVFYDPACGAGDLLLEASNTLETFPSLEVTLNSWASLLIGGDLQPDFIRLAKARLTLAAIARGARVTTTSLHLSTVFPDLRTADAFQSPVPRQVQHILLNPPFGAAKAPPDCNWAQGKVCRAAIFLDHFLQSANQGTSITAILPDVLRSGTRYSKWRKHITSLASVRRVLLWGPFDPYANVDVFILRLLKADLQSEATSAQQWHQVPPTATPTVGDFFEVRVGPVVPHRDPHHGLSAPYLHSRNCPPWTEFATVLATRQFVGPLMFPPFVAVRRTSSPRSQFRAVASVYLGDDPVAVENHLLVLKPKQPSPRLCRQLLNWLKRQDATDWLNDRIRCRHLTVGSISELPFQPQDDSDMPKGGFQ